LTDKGVEEDYHCRLEKIKAKQKLNKKNQALSKFYFLNEFSKTS